MTKSDFWIGLLLMGVAIAALVPALSFASVPGMQFGAWTFPVFISIGLGLCGALLSVRALAARPQGGEPTSMPQFNPSAIAGFALIVGACLFYVLAADRLGFLVTSSLIVLAVSLFFWRKPIACLILTLMAVPVAELVFGRAFSVPLPRGLLSVTGLF